MIIYQKIIDRSALREGFQIPVEFHPLLETLPNGIPKRGEIRKIKIIIDGVAYDAELKNQLFDQVRYAGHSDVIQVRYGINSAIAKQLRKIFSVSWDYVERMKSLPGNENRKFKIRIPEDQQEFIALNSTNQPNVFIAEYITIGQKKEAKSEIEQIRELDFETFEPRTDKNATIQEVTRLQRIRHLDRSIGDSLKKLYNYTCQMTEERIGESYDALVVEAHHIIPFTKSMDNDTSNIIILSPSYHRIVHYAKPIFDRKNLAFIYPNGFVDKVRLDKHLRIGINN